MRAALLALAQALAVPSGEPTAPGPQPTLPLPSALVGTSLVCRDRDTGTTCQLWLERDGRYRVAFNRGPQKLLPSIDGPWQIEGREGRYVFRRFHGAVQLCLTPDSGTGSYEVERAGELYAGAGCYPLALHAVGERWVEKDQLGRDIDMWLVAGR